MSPAQIQAALDALAAQAKANTDAETAAVAVLTSFQARVDAAVAKVLADNPTITAAQLQGITDETAALGASAATLGAAIVANTPAA